MMSITTAPMVTTGSGLASPRTTASSLKQGRNKKHKLGSLSPSRFPNSTVSIVPHEVHHPVSFKQTASSFNHNVSSLCVLYPSVHRGVITSLLESAANDYLKASSLVRQISESGLHTAIQSGSNSLPTCRRKRPREWNDDVFMGDEEEGIRNNIHDDSNSRTESHLNNNGSNNSEVVQLHTATTATACLIPPYSETTATATSEMELQNVPSFQHSSTLHQFQDQLPSAPCPQGTTCSSSSSATSANYTADIIMNPSLSSSNPSAEASSSTKTLPGAAPQGLQHTVQVLSRVVLKQSDKISSLQLDQRRLVEEIRELKSTLVTTTEELRQCRDTNEILQFYLSSNRASTDFGNNGNGTDGGGGFDFFSTNRMPDVF